jgi:alpha-1,6-mannosyltransferase
MTAPIHVVDATMFWSPTGGGVRRYLLAKHDWLARRPGWRHTLAVPGGTGAAALPSVPLPGSGGYRVPLRRGAVARVLQSLRPDLIEAGDPYRVAWGALDAARACGVPAVATCHSNLEAMARLAAGARLGGIAARAARRYARHLYRRFDLVLAPSRGMREHLVDWGVEGAVVQPLGVDTRTFHPDRAASTGWRAALGLGADDRVLVYAGRFAPEKHLDVLAAAAAKLGPPHVLLAIGAGPAPPLAGEHVRIVPFVADVTALASILAGADVFVHAGDQETFGLSALEAMACGTPIVVRKAEGLAELADGRSGLAVEHGSGAAFADAIAALLAGDRAAQRRAARERAEAYDWERVFPALLGHYHRLLDAGSPATAPSASPVPAP